MNKLELYTWKNRFVEEVNKYQLQWEVWQWQVMDQLMQKIDLKLGQQIVWVDGRKHQGQCFEYLVWNCQQSFYQLLYRLFSKFLL